MKNKKIIFSFVICLGIVAILVIWKMPRMSEKKITLYTGHSKTIRISGIHNEAKWSTTDDEIATVSQKGCINAVSEGKAQIICKIWGKEYTCDVTIKKSMSPYYYSLVQTEKEWILSQQLNNGAFCDRYKDNGEVSINPYFCENTVLSLLECNPNEKDYACIKKYLEWHFKHLNNTVDYNNVVGTIYDYKATIKDGNVIDENTEQKYDSTDSYAALFLACISRYYEMTGDKSFLADNEQAVNNVTDAMLGTIKDGFSIAKPDYHYKYIMDNAEVYEGLVSAEKIYSKLFEDKARYNEVKKARVDFEKAFDKTWLKGNHYTTVLNLDNTDGVGNNFSWKEFYMCAVPQLYPVIYGVKSSDDKISNEIYQTFCENWNWMEMDYYTSKEDSFYWPVLLYNAVKMNDIENAETYINNYKKVTEDRKYPLIVSEASWFMRGCNELARYYEKLENENAD